MTLTLQQEEAPAATEPDGAHRMYYDHFGLTQAPFKITPNTDFFFSGGNRGPVLEALLYAITHGEGIVKVSGEVGSGKTMLCNMLQNRLPPNVESVYLSNPSVAPEDVLHAIAFELGIGVDRQADRLEVMHALQDYLVQQHANGQRIVVFVEESQSMPVATLEEIRLLSNLETGDNKLLQMVLFGQPELDELLRRPDIRQLRDRIAHSFRLEPLNDAQVNDYLSFRMRAAGYRGPHIFSAAVVKRIARAAGGLTRRINLIADKTLLAAFSENTHTIENRHVQAALRDSEFGPAQRKPSLSLSYAWIGVSLLTGTALGATLYALVSPGAAQQSAASQSSPPRPGATAPAARLAPAASGTASTVPPSVAPTSTGAVISTAGTSGVAPPGGGPPGGSLQPASERLVVAMPARADTSDVIANRIQAAEAWLNSDGARPFSVQLLATSNEQQLRNHLKTLANFFEMKDVYMFRTVARGRPAVSVLWGAFASRQDAVTELQKLPSQLRVDQPYVRSIRDIRAEVDRHSGTR